MRNGKYHYALYNSYEICLIVRTLFEKSNLCPKIQFWQIPTFSRVFHQIIFWQFFSWNQSCQQLKSPKPQHFHDFFTQKIDNFLGKPKVEFLDKKWRFRTVWKSAGKFKFPNSCSEYHHFLYLMCFSTSYLLRVLRCESTNFEGCF